MSLLYGITRPLGYSGSTPPSEHCPECNDCKHRVTVEAGRETPLCTEPEEHELCGWHLEEAKQAEGEALMEREREGGW